MALFAIFMPAIGLFFFSPSPVKRNFAVAFHDCCWKGGRGNRKGTKREKTKNHTGKEKEVGEASLQKVAFPPSFCAIPPPPPPLLSSPFPIYYTHPKSRLLPAMHHLLVVRRRRRRPAKKTVNVQKMAPWLFFRLAVRK